MSHYKYHWCLAEDHLAGTRRQDAPRRGLTLVEMLIALGIIVLLAAILLPVVGRARETARRTSCLSNLQQLGKAFQLYAQDASQRFPRAGVYTSFAGHSSGWGPGNGHWVAGTEGAGGQLACIGGSAPGDVPAGCAVGNYITGRQANPEEGAIFPYVRNSQIFICPSNATGRQKKLSYSMNCAVSGLHDVRISQPSDIVLLVDEEKANDGYFFAVDDAAAASTVGGAPTNSTDSLTTIHNGGGNLVFCDGHAKFFPTQKLKLDVSPEGKANKWRDTGSPRFHDPGFSPKPAPAGQKSTGSNWFKTPAGVFYPTDACNASVRLN